MPPTHPADPADPADNGDNAGFDVDHHIYTRYVYVYIVKVVKWSKCSLSLQSVHHFKELHHSAKFGIIGQSSFRIYSRSRAQILLLP